MPLDLAAAAARRRAIRASLCILVALLTLWASRRLDLGLYATFGAFASVYGGGTHPHRWRTQTALGLVLTAAVGTGALVGLSGDSEWLLIPVTAVWAGLAAWLSDAHGWRPPGPLFPTFAVAACGSVSTASGAVAVAAGVAASTAGFAVLLGVLEAWLAPERAPAAVPDKPAHTHTHTRTRRVIQVLRCAIVVVVAGTTATTLGTGHPYWAMVAAVVPFSVVGLRQQLVRSAHRAAGTVAGLGAAAALLTCPLPVPVVILVVTILQGLTELVVARNYAAALLFVTPLALLLGQLTARQPAGPPLFDRLLETLLGVAVGTVAAVLTRNRTGPGAERATGV